MSRYDVISAKAVWYMEREYPSLIKYRYKIAIIVYNNKEHIPEDVTALDLINVMSAIINRCLVKDAQKKGGVKW